MPEAAIKPSNNPEHEAARVTEFDRIARKAVSDLFQRLEGDNISYATLFGIRGQSRLACEALTKLLDWNDDGCGKCTLPDGKTVNAREPYYICSLVERATEVLMLASHPEYEGGIIPEQVQTAWALTMEMAKPPLKAFLDW
jgi:hypothetical protein